MCLKENLLNFKRCSYKIVPYPVAQFVIVFGFFVILTIEQTVLHFQVKLY